MTNSFKNWLDLVGSDTVYTGSTVIHNCILAYFL